MAKPPAVDAEQFGAALDALCTTNAMMFMTLASQEQSDAALGLLDKLGDQLDSTDGLHAIRAYVAQATAATIRSFQAIGEGKTLAAARNRN